MYKAIAFFVKLGPWDEQKGAVGKARSTSLLTLESISGEFGLFEAYSFIWIILRQGKTRN